MPGSYAGLGYSLFAVVCAAQLIPEQFGRAQQPSIYGDWGYSMDEEGLRQEVANAYKAYLAAFLRNDLTAIDRLVRYPLAYVTAEGVKLVDAYPINPAQLIAEKEWHNTTDSQFEVVAVSEDKAHVILRNAKRRRRDGSLIETISAFYAFTRLQDGWKMVAFSDIVIPAP
jgi:hypothetical protein